MTDPSSTPGGFIEILLLEERHDLLILFHERIGGSEASGW